VSFLEGLRLAVGGLTANRLRSASTAACSLATRACSCCSTSCRAWARLSRLTAAKAAGWRVTIVSSDKDLMQLIEEPQIDMLDTMNDRRIGRNEVLEKFGVPPEKVGDVLALMGDSVDNVPGVPGIGPKTASQLIQTFGDLETVLASTDQITKPKLKQSLIDHADNARLSRELVRLVCDSALPEPLEDLKLKGIPPEPLKQFLEEQGFKTLLNRMIGGPQQTGATVRNDVMAAMEAKTIHAIGLNAIARRNTSARATDEALPVNSSSRL